MKLTQKDTPFRLILGLEYTRYSILGDKVSDFFEIWVYIENSSYKGFRL